MKSLKNLIIGALPILCLVAGCVSQDSTLPVINKTKVSEKKREAINLRGIWKYQQANDAKQLLKQLPADAWKQANVPGDMRQYTKAHHVWFQKEVYIPENWRNRIIKVFFENVCRRAIVYFNGKCVGQQEGGRLPFWIDVTPFVKFGKSNTLTVKVSDMSVYQVNPSEDVSQRIKLASWNPGNSGYNRFEGIVGEVYLEKYPQIYIDDVYVKTSVLNKRLDVEITVKNNSQLSGELKFLAYVLDNNRNILPLNEKILNADSKKTSFIELSLKWENPELWYPNNPKLYTLRVDILDQSGKIIDTKDTEFGFREFRVGNKKLGEDPAFFYLNGKICKIRNTEISAYRGKGEDHSDLNLREKTFLRDFNAVKDANINMIRFFEVADDWHYKICNKRGMMVATLITRCEPWQTLFIGEKKFNVNKGLFQKYKKNMTEYVKRWIRYTRNNPSIVMWGLSNENLHFREYEDELVEYFISLEKTAKKLDPTRPVFFSGDGDLYGKTDVITLHGVREVPGRSASPDKGILPNYAYFSELKEPRKFETHRYFGLKGKSKWRWDCQKPVYFAEWPYSLKALCTQKSAPISIGEEAFKKPLWKNAMKADAILMKTFIGAARYLDFPSVGPFTLTGASASPNPPTPVTESCKRSLTPKMAEIKECDNFFYAKKTIPRTVTIYNGSYFKASFELVWKFKVNDKIILSGIEKCILDAGRLYRKIIDLKMPDVAIRTEGTFSYVLKSNGETVLENSQNLSVYPVIEALENNPKIAVFDPGNTLKLPYIKLQNLDKIDSQILIVAKNASNKIKNTLAFLDFIKKGGRALILQQKAPNYDLLPARFPLAPTISSSMTFPASSGHPILKDLKQDDLKYWTGQGNNRHVVSRLNYIRPTLGNVITIVAAGTGQGLNVSPLLEIQYGKGVIVASQMELTAKFNEAPQADIIFRNITNYLQMYKKNWKIPKIYSGENSLLALSLARLGVNVEPILDSNVELNSQKDIILIDGQIKMCNSSKTILNKIKSFAQNGGTVYIWNMGSEAFEKLLPAIGISARQVAVDEQNYPLNRVADGKLVYGITSQEVFWQKSRKGKNAPGEYVGGGHYIEPLYKGIINSGYHLSNGKEFISSGALSEVYTGKGNVILDQIDWVKGLSINYRPLALRYICSLLTNLDIQIDISKADMKVVGISNWQRAKDGKKVNTHYPIRYKNILKELGFPCKMIGSKHLTDLDSINLLIVMDGMDKEKRGKGLNSNEASKIAEFLKNGGNAFLEDNACVPQFMNGNFLAFSRLASGKITGVTFLNSDNPKLTKRTFKLNLKPHFMTFIPAKNWNGKILAYWEIDNKPSKIPAMVSGRYGKGRFAYMSCKYYWLYKSIAKESHKDAMQIKRMMSNILANLYGKNEKSKIKIENCTFIDLRAVCNRSFIDDVPGDEKGGWTDQGSSQDLDKFSYGTQYLDGTPFKIIDPTQNNNNSCIVLKSSANGKNLPDKVIIETGNLYADRLNFLHTAAWVHESKGKEIFYYHILYGDNDGTTLKVPILNQKHIADWYKFKPDISLENTGKIPIFSDNRQHSLFSYKWINPRPDLPIQRIEIISPEKVPLPIIIAITAERNMEENK
jgi:glycosyl hydrolase family 2